MHPFLAPTRRSLLGEIGLLIGASALPASALAVPKKTTKRFLTAPQYATLLALTDTIMPTTDTPGALAAQVPARIDAMLAKWASAKTRENILGALDRLDTAAKAQKSKNFSALNAAERAELLKPYDAAALKSVPPPAGSPKPSLFSTQTFVADQGYFQIKTLVLDLYYFSAVGSANELAYVHVPGKFQPSIKLTAQSRPELGTGPF